MKDFRQRAEAVKQGTSLQREPEHVGPIWTHPYMLYVLFTVPLFLLLIFLGLLALKSGWIPDRGIHGAAR